MEIENKRAIVTGAARGLGRAIAETLASSGARVIVVDIDESGLEETVRRIVGLGGEAFGFKADVTAPDDVSRMVAEAEIRLGGLEILINNAGGPPQTGFPTTDRAEWERCVRLNLHGPMLTIQSALPLMRRTGAAAIVNVASIAGVVNGPSPWPEYAAAKAGLIRLTEAIAAELASHGIRVNAVAPNFVLTERIKEQLAQMTTEQREAIPPPLSTPEEVAEAIIALIRDESVSGRTLMWWFDEPHLAPADRVHAWLPTVGSDQTS